MLVWWWSYFGEEVGEFQPPNIHGSGNERHSGPQSTMSRARHQGQQDPYLDPSLDSTFDNILT